jgi:dTDP-4-amino-4,6-dideoxygalactose transaminase
MITYFDYRPALLEIQGEVEQAIRRVLASGRLILGPEVRAFEEEFAAYVGLPAAVGVNSGTDALVLALRALEIGPGDEVATVANAGVPPVAAIRAVGATPRLVDVHPATLLLDPERAEAALTPRTRCIVAVHLYGQPAPMGALAELASRRGLRVIEDCAQAHGASYRGRHVGHFGDVGCFSFYPTKNLGALGDGGMCVTSDPELAERIRMQRTYGFRDDAYAHCEGLNSRLDELHAAVLRVKLRHLDAALAARRAIARQYREGLEDSSCRPLEVDSEGEHAYHLFVVQAPDRDHLTRALDRAGIGYGIHYPVPVHLMEAYRFLGYREGDLPVAEAASEAVISLPLYPGLGSPDVDKVIETLRSLPWPPGGSEDS